MIYRLNAIPIKIKAGFIINYTSLLKNLSEKAQGLE